MARESGFWYRLASGFIIGLAIIIPGVSGGILAMVLGIYKPVIAAIAKPLENLQDNLKLLVPLGLGAGSCLLLLSRVLEFLFAQHPLPTLYFFFGLVIAGFPTVLEMANAKGFRLSYLVSLLIGLVLIFVATGLPSYLSQGAPSSTGLFSSLWKGAALGVGLVIPGFSSSLLLIALGFYEELLGAVARLDLGILIPMSLGVIPAVVMASRMITWLFRWKQGQIYYAILGIMLGSLVVAFPGLPRTVLEVILCGALFGCGIWMASLFKR